METKLCPKCNILQDVNNFNKAKKHKDGLSCHCKNCISKYKKEYYLLNSKNIKERVSKNSLLKTDKKSEYDKIYRQLNKDRISKLRHEYYTKNRTKQLESSKNYIRNRRKLDPLFKLKMDMRTMLNKIFKHSGFTKKSKTFEILGCNYDEFKIYLESKFEPWMNWENRGNWNGIPNETNISWDIDHIEPITEGKTEQDINKLNHYTNLQPLCSYTNRWVKRDN